MGRYFVRKAVILLLILYALKLTSYSFLHDAGFTAKIESAFSRHVEAITAMGSSLLDMSR